MKSSILVVDVDASDALRVLRGIKADFNPSKLLEVIGMRQLAWINENFVQEGRLLKAAGWDKLKASTLAMKAGRGAILQGSPPNLKRSFGYKVGGDSVVVGTEIPYAIYHEKGTAPYKIFPKGRGAGGANALKFMTSNGPIFRKFVNHPGLPARPMLPDESIARDLAQKVLDGVVNKYVKN